MRALPPLTCGSLLCCALQEIPTRRAAATYVRSNDKVQCSELCPTLHVANECAQLRVSTVTVPVCVPIPEFQKLEHLAAAQYMPLAHAPWWAAEPSTEAPPEAVFPCPVPCLDDEHTALTMPQLAVCQRRASFFHLLGQLVGQSFADGRLLDLPLATPFLRAVIQRERLHNWKAGLPADDQDRRSPFHLQSPSDLKRDMADLHEARRSSAPPRTRNTCDAARVSLALLYILRRRSTPCSPSRWHPSWSL